MTVGAPRSGRRTLAVVAAALGVAAVVAPPLAIVLLLAAPAAVIGGGIGSIGVVVDLVTGDAWAAIASDPWSAVAGGAGAAADAIRAVRAFAWFATIGIGVLCAGIVLGAGAIVAGWIGLRRAGPGPGAITGVVAGALAVVGAGALLVVVVPIAQTLAGGLDAVGWVLDPVTGLLLRGLEASGV